MKSRRYILIAILCSALSFTGCSLIGYGAGTAATVNREFNSKTQKFDIIDSAETIIVLTRNGETIEGEFINFSKRPFNDYTETYELIINQLNDSITLPKIGEEIFCKGIPFYYQIKGNPYTQRILKDTTMTFLGFDFGKIILSENKHLDSRSIPVYSLGGLVNQNGCNYDINKLASLMSNGDLPINSNLNIKIVDKELSIKGEEIEKIELDNTSYAGIGFIIGLGIDMIVVYSNRDEMFKFDLKANSDKR